MNAFDRFTEPTAFTFSRPEPQTQRKHRPEAEGGKELREIVNIE